MAKHDFTQSPMVRRGRTRMDLSHGVKTSMSLGNLYPLKVVEVLPGDTFKTDMTAVCRCTSAFLKPIVDNLFMDVYHFFVPYRLVYKDTERVFGNPNPSAWIDEELKSFPTLPVSEITPGTVGDYLALPISEGSESSRRYVKKGINVLPFRAFALVYNTWFRNENTVDEVLVQTGELADSERPNNNAWSSSNYFGKLPKVGKKKDYFTAGLPGVQKGAGVQVPLGTFGNYLPVIVRGDDSWTAAGISSNETPLRWARFDDLAPLSSTKNNTPYFLGIGDIDGLASNPNNSTIAAWLGHYNNVDEIFDSFIPYGNDHDQFTVSDNGKLGLTGFHGVVPRNLFAVADSVDISVLRDAFQLQKIKETLARGGSRYNEFIYSMFGVSTPDSRLQIPEFLGGGRIPISITQVAQTSEGTETSPQANVAGYSLTVGRSHFNKGFTEYGLVITVGCIRQEHTYQQGVPRYMMRKSRDDYYNPVLANISEQPVWKGQLYGYASSSSDTEAIDAVPFNYNEAWADYRYEPSIITGQMRSGLSNSLDIWHLGDYYESAPTFGQSFTDETSANIDRVLAVETSSQDNFLCDLWFKCDAIRVMPLYSVPGLVDHH